MNKTTSCFIHVRKSAGTALIRLLQEIYGADRVLDAKELLQRQPPLGEMLARFPVVAGHFTFAQISPELLERTFVFTFLREPVDRVLSLYHYYQQEGLEDNLTIRLAKSASLEKIAADLGDSPRPSAWSNSQTYTFSGATDFQQPAEALLPAALRNLERLDFVGIHAAFDEGVRCLGARLGWTTAAPPPRANVTVARPAVGQITPALRERLQQLNACDALLYARACELWEAARARPVVQIAGPPVDVGDAGAVASIPPVATPAARPAIHARAEQGTKEIFFTDLRVSDQRTGQGGRVEHGSTLRVELRGHSEVTAAGLNIGIRLTDALGMEVYGLSTMLIGQSLAFAAGDDFQVALTCEMTLSAGRYHVTVALIGGDDHRERCYHWIDHALSFECWSARPLPFAGFVDLKARLDVASGPAMP